MTSNLQFGSNQYTSYLLFWLHDAITYKQLATWTVCHYIQILCHKAMSCPLMSLVVSNCFHSEDFKAKRGNVCLNVFLIDMTSESHKFCLFLLTTRQYLNLNNPALKTGKNLSFKSSLGDVADVTILCTCLFTVCFLQTDSSNEAWGRFF